jgi:hypothetical protein
MIFSKAAVKAHDRERRRISLHEPKFPGVRNHTGMLTTLPRRQP